MASTKDFQTVSHMNISRGVDKRSAPNNLQPGFAEDIRNMDTNSTGFVKKRKGYQGYHGFLPLRISEFQDNGNDTGTFVFDQDINLITADNSPLVVYGLIGGSGAAEEIYIPTFTNDTIKALDPSVSQPITKIIGNTSDSISALVGSVILTGVGSSNKAIIPDNVTMTSSNVTYLFDLTGHSDILSSYLFMDDTSLADTFLYGAEHTTDVSGNITISNSTHKLPNFNIVPQIFRVVGSDYQLVIPDTLKVQANGDILIETSEPSQAFQVVIYDMPGEYYQEIYYSPEDVDTNPVQSVTFNNITNPFNFYGVVKLNDDSTRNLVFPEEFEYDSAAQTITFQVRLDEGGVRLGLSYMPGIAASNSITVPTGSGTGMDTWTTDTNPQACLYGISQEDITYSPIVLRGGYIHGMAEYSSQGVNHLVTAFDGVLYRESSTSGDPLTLPSNITVDWSSRTSGSKYIGPFFGGYSVGDQRGLNADEINTTDTSSRFYRKAPIRNITNNGDQTITVTLATLTNRTGTLSDLIVGKDTAVLSNVGDDWYSGTFTISSYTEYDDIDPENIVYDTITLDVPNLPEFIPSKSGMDGEISIQSALLVLDSSDTQYVIGDLISSTLFSGYTPDVIAVDGSNLYIDCVQSDVIVASAARMGIVRVTDTLRMSVMDNLIEGDIVSLSGYDQHFRILDVNYDIDDVTPIEIVLDESVQIVDSSLNPTKLSVTGRWAAIEAPDSNDNKQVYFDSSSYGNQPKLKDASINDSVFLSNYVDGVMKYDGNNIYRSGLVSWNPHMSSWIDYDSPKIPVDTQTYIQAVGDNTADTTVLYFQSIGAMPDVVVGDTVYVDSSGLSATTTFELIPGFADVIEVDEVNYTVTVNNNMIVDSVGTPADGTTDLSATVTVPIQAAYYFKAQAIDRNNNIVASAVTNFQDCVVTLSGDGTIIHRLAGFPKFDVYDYERIDLMVYRSKFSKTASAPFFEVRRYSIDYSDIDKYRNIIIVDSAADATLPSVPDDTVSIALKGAELPLSSNEPPRSKYIKSVGSKLVLANIKSYNTIDVSILSEAGIQEDNVMNGTVVDVSDGTTTYSFDYFNPIDSTTKTLITTDGTDERCRKIDSITFSASTDEFTLNFGGVIDPLTVVGRWVQIESFLTENPGDASLRDSEAATEIDYNNGRICGWWKVKSATSISMTIEHTHGLTSNWAYTGTDAPMYVAFNDGSSKDEIPVLALPYSNIVGSNAIVSKITYRDMSNAIEFTTAVQRGLMDLRVAFNRIMVEDTSPWAFANSGATEGARRIVFKSVNPDDTLSVTFTKGSDSYVDIEVFVNQILTADGVSSDGISYVFPSRLLISKANYPEMFDNPFATDATYSDSLVDVNSNDGQEITGMSSFFSVSSTSDSSLEDTLIVFKNKSVFALNTSTRAYKKLESLGQGCTIPESISPAQDGIMFANESGIYKVTRELTVVYIGDRADNYWKDDVNKDVIDVEAFGFTDTLDRKYKLSVPTTTTRNSEVVVFDYIADSQKKTLDAWTFYDNFPAVMWKQTKDSTFFGSYNGRVFSLRDTGGVTDYRDDNSGIASTFLYGATSFGDSGTRVNVGRVITHLRADTPLTELQLETSVDMENTFEDAGTISFDAVDNKLYSIASSIPTRHCLFLQVKYTHDKKDEDLVIAGIDFEVSALDELGITQADE